MEFTLRKALTKVIYERDRRGHMKRVEVPPSDHFLLGIQFSFVALLCLTLLEIIYMFMMKVFSSEIFASIALTIGTILGAVFAQKV